MNIFKRMLCIFELIHRVYISRKLNCNYLVHVKRPIYLVGNENIHVGKAFCADESVKIEAWDSHLDEKYTPNIIIGDSVFLNSRTHISTIQELKIGNGVLIGSDVLICDNNHGECNSLKQLEIPPRNRSLYSKGPINIGDNVWIGDKVVILGGVTIGEGSVIGAGSIVTSDVPAYCVAVGNPAKVVRRLKYD